MAQLKVLDINNLYSPTGGGIRVYHNEKLKWCRRNNIKNLLLFPASSDIQLENGVIQGIKSPKLGKSGYNFFVNGRLLREAILEFDPDIVELGSGIVVPAMVKKTIQNIPSFAYFHSNWTETLPMSLFGVSNRKLTGLFQKLSNPLMRRAYRSLDSVFAGSEYSLSKLTASGLSNLTKVPLGVDVNLFHPDKKSSMLRVSLGVESQQKMVLYMGRLAPEKGIHVFLDACKHLVKNKSIVIVIAGSGHYTKQVKKMVQKYPKRMKFINKVHSREETAQLMASADIFVSAGPFETFSLTTLESLCSGTPVAACRQAAASELILKARGESVYSPWNCPEALAAAIQSGIVASQTEINSYRNFARLFTWDACFTKIFSTYKKFL